MDTNTVFKIIEMIDARISHVYKNATSEATNEAWLDEIDYAKIEILEELKDHLQFGFIEAQVNQAENTMNTSD